MKKILVTPRSFGKRDPEPIKILESAGYKIVANDTGNILTENSIIQLLDGCDGVILGVDPMSEKVILSAPNLKAIAKYGVGLDNIDLDACKRRSIAVSRTAGANTNAVADYTFALLLSVARNIIPIDKACRNNDWSKQTSIDVFGKTIGLIGLGAIAKGVAIRAKGFGMNVLASDVFWDDSYAKANGIVCASLAEIYSQSDFISVHVPLLESTKNMISAKEIEMMKPSVILINTARGGIVNEDDLLFALKTKRIYGAGIDAFKQEPPSNQNWYLLDNVVLGSHCAASTFGATQQMGCMAARNIIKDLERVIRV